MKKVIIAVLLLAAVGLVAWKLFAGKEEKHEEKQKPVPLGKNTGPFNESFAHLLTGYYALKEALIASDSVKAATVAATLKNASDSLKVDEIQGDSTGMIKETARSYMGNISTTAQVLVVSKTLDEQRKQFESIADAIWTLTRTVQYSGQKIYWQYCPMAFNNEGAYWMSNEADIRNPYFGKKMLTCGSTQDSLDYSQK
jgi:Cu(I)/Ag(I) efflux system membrane fusion protein